MQFSSLLSTIGHKCLQMHLSHEIRMLAVGLRKDPLTTISPSNITIFDGQKNVLIVREKFRKIFLALDIPEEKKTLMAYHLSTGKAADLVGKFLETNPGTTRDELRTLQRLSNIRQSAGWGCIEK